MFVYTIQPVVKPVVKPVWQPLVSFIQTFNRLSNPFDNRFDKTAVSCIQPVVKPAVQPGLTTGWTNNGCSFITVVKPVVKPGCTTGWQPCWTNSLFVQHFVKPCLSNGFDKPGLTTGWTNSCSFNTVVKRVVKPVWQPVWQPTVSCKRGLRINNLLQSKTCDSSALVSLRLFHAYVVSIVAYRRLLSALNLYILHAVRCPYVCNVRP